MKTPARRLGRGLGAFLDFGPAGEQGAASLSASLADGTASILETSAVAPPAPPAARTPVPAPAVPAPAPVPPPPAPVADDSVFVDDLVGPLTFTDVELE